MPTPSYRLGKSDILRHKKAITSLFQVKSTLKVQVYPIKCIVDNNAIERDAHYQTLFIVPSRVIKKANDRNLIRRRMKEAFRLQKPFFDELFRNQPQKNIGLMYLANEITTFEQMVKAIKKIGNDLAQKYK